MKRLYRRSSGQHAAHEECFYIDLRAGLNPQQLNDLKWLLSEPLTVVSEESCFSGDDVVEIGPRLSVETPLSSNAVAICASMGIIVRRIERSVRYRHSPGLGISSEMNRDEITEQFLDRMTQAVYPSVLTTFETGVVPELVQIVPILEEGEVALREANERLGLGMDEWDISFYTEMFRDIGRNPTDVELFQIGNANSEHSRHWFFRGKHVIDGVEMPLTLMELVRRPWEAKHNQGKSLVAFHDNSGVMYGTEVLTFMPRLPGQPSRFWVVDQLTHLTATAETHNHPTLIAPFPGAETGSGGRIRDNRAVGRGGLVHAGLAGYCVGNLHIPGFLIAGEDIGGEFVRNAADPLRVLIEGSNGISDYGNKIGEPLIGGFTRSFGQVVDGVRREFRKPVLYTGGVGRLFDAHVEKHKPEVGMKIIRIGGPAFRIGVGGGAASSLAHGDQDVELDFQSVQRGDAEMENRANRVIQACAELGANNPIESIHDQGAGGPSNVLTELMEPIGGRVDIRQIVLGDTTMSVLEIWVAEYQEGYGLLIHPDKLDAFKAICERERVNCEVLGEVTGDGRVVVEDSADGSTPVDLSLGRILGDLPQKTYESKRPKANLEPLIIPEGLTVAQALERVFTLPQIGSKGFLVRKVDRFVTGLVAQQQCCGPHQVPVSDVAVTADGYFGLTGAATALGEAPNKMLIDPGAGARMAVAEMVTNLASARISDLSDVICRANWMWAAKLNGEGALLYDAAQAMSDFMLKLGIAIDGGKDSLSMATNVDGEQVIAPGELVIMGYAPVPDITKVVTPDLKGSGCLGYLDLGAPYRRLGGSSFAQSLGQLGDEAPDLDGWAAHGLKNAFAAVQELIEKGLITAYHDVSDGGLVTAIAEMCIAGNRGARIRLNVGTDIFPFLFAEEAGMLFEYDPKSRRKITNVMKRHDVIWDSSRNQVATVERSYGGNLCVHSVRETWLDVPVASLRQWWEATSTELEKLQAKRETVEAESSTHGDVSVPQYTLPFTPEVPNLCKEVRPKVAILREEGTNGDREMAAAFYTAGFETWDITMSDLRKGKATSLDDMRGLVFPGGFSYADVFGSARGWAGGIRFNDELREMFDRFYERSDTFSFGVCNGCQLMANLGWLPEQGLADEMQPRFTHNLSGRFESRWAMVKILRSPSIMLSGMEGTTMGVVVAHGEGRLLVEDQNIRNDLHRNQLVPLVYVDPNGEVTEQYPYNPNGSTEGWTALCSRDGRHLAMMPHPERSFLMWQWPWMPKQWRSELTTSPWLQMFHNAYNWCQQG